MSVAVHRIAGITFRTESNVPLLSLEAQPLALFRVDDSERPDVQHRIHRLPKEALTLPVPVGEEEAQILQSALLDPVALEGPMLRAPTVREWFREAPDQTASKIILLHRYQATKLGFDRHVVDFCYIDDPDLDSAYAEAVPIPGDDGSPKRYFRIYHVTPDPRRAPPLPARERAEFARYVQFSGPDVLDHPLLRAPIVRTRLHVALNESKKVLAMDRAGGLMIWTVDEDVMDFYYFLDLADPREERVVRNYQHMFTAFLLDYLALPVHSAGLILDGRAALFLAPDEGGKTTVLQLAKDGYLLSDDQVIVKREGEGIIAHATPFGKLTSGPGQAPLGGLFVLEKACRFDLAPLKPAELVKILWDEHLSYTSILPRPLKLRAFNLLYDMCHRVPVYRLSFPRDHMDWEAIDIAMAGEA
jgi:hypothetical protein